MSTVTSPNPSIAAGAALVAGGSWSSPGKGAPIRVVPDWVSEVLSPRTRGYDNIIKKRFYAEIGVAHLWYVDPEERSLRVLQLVEGKWLELGTYGADEKVRVAPFDLVELELAGWFEGLPAEEE